MKVTGNEVRLECQNGPVVVQDTIPADPGEKEADPESAQVGN